MKIGDGNKEEKRRGRIIIALEPADVSPVSDCERCLSGGHVPFIFRRTATRRVVIRFVKMCLIGARNFRAFRHCDIRQVSHLAR